MLSKYKKEIENIIQKFGEKQVKKLGVKSLINLSVKLKKFEDEDIEEMMLELKAMLSKMSEDELIDLKIFKKQLVSLKSIVGKKYDLYERGSVQALYLGSGLVLGTVIGLLISSSVPSGMPLASSLGLAIGVSFGFKKEKTLEKEGKLY